MVQRSIFNLLDFYLFCLIWGGAGVAQWEAAKNRIERKLCFRRKWKKILASLFKKILIFSHFTLLLFIDFIRWKSHYLKNKDCQIEFVTPKRKTIFTNLKRKLFNTLNSQVERLMMCKPTKKCLFVISTRKWFACVLLNG